MASAEGAELSTTGSRSEEVRGPCRHFLSLGFGVSDGFRI